MEFRIVSLFSCFVLMFLVSAELVGTVDPPSLFVRKGYPMVVRKLLASLDDDYDSNPNGCTKDDIVIYQGTTSPLPNGIPTYTVQILNVCVSGRAISEIHVNCGWFSSARLINPNVFRRLCYDDCLVNNGEDLGPGESLSFQYANSFSYHLSVSSVAC